MDRVEVKGRILDECESVVDVPVKTRGSGDYGQPVIVLLDLNATRNRRGTSSGAGAIKDDDGSIIGERLVHHYEATATIEAQSADELESHELANECKNRFAKFSEYPNAFHQDCNDLNTTSIEDAGLAVQPPDPLYKHAFTVYIDYTEYIEHTDSSLVGDEIEEIHSDIENNS